MTFRRILINVYLFYLSVRQSEWFLINFNCEQPALGMSLKFEFGNP